MLEFGKISGAQSIGFCNDWDEVNASAETLHDLDVKRFESVTSRSDEVKTRVNAKVDFIRTTRLLLLQHIGLMLVVEELNDRLPGITVVYIVTKSRGINDGQAHCAGKIFVRSPH